MSLRFRLVALIVALVALVSLALSGFELDTLLDMLSGEALDRSQLASQQVYASLIEHINPAGPGGSSSPDAAETQAQWNLVSSPVIAKILLETLARWPSVVEINVAGATGLILASSTDSRIGTELRHLESFTAWRVRPLSQRLRDVVQRRPDLEVTVNIGPEGTTHPLFTIQVVSSTVLLRDVLEPQARRLGTESGAAVLASLLLTLLFSNILLAPVRRIEQTIDRIVQGTVAQTDTVPVASTDLSVRSSRTHFRQFPRPHFPHGSAREFRAVENKLSILGQQYQGAREDVRKLRDRIDVAVERMASQLDVASRLAAISRLSGGVAHEIKNPLNAIMLRLDLLREHLGGPEEELALEIGILSKEVLRLDRVVKTFLDFSRPLDVRFQNLDLAAIAREVTDLMTPQARHSGVQVDFHAPEAPSGGAAPSVWMRGDPDLLKQAILNLVTNALEAMKQGGQLRITVGSSARDASSTGAASVEGTVTLEVADTGAGIPPAVQAKVFQLYFTTKEKGSGIGLAMTYRAVQVHNGTIEFDSEPGRGTSFLLQFPALSGPIV